MTMRRWLHRDSTNSEPGAVATGSEQSAILHSGIRERSHSLYRMTDPVATAPGSDFALHLDLITQRDDHCR
jgi:hypothetical protein